MPNALFIFTRVEGPAADRIREVQRRYDPKLAAMHAPHLTLAGSSGVGPILGSVPLEAVRDAMAAVASATPPLLLPFGPPKRFMQTEIVSLPLDPHGPIRELHERIARSGLAFARARYTFTPHVTLSFYPTLTRERARELLAIRVNDPAQFTSLTVSTTDDPMPPQPLFELRFGAPDGPLARVD